MRIRHTTMGLALFLVTIAAASVFAHHSFSVEFDAEKELKVTGNVTKVEWKNPHAWFFVDAVEVCEGPRDSERNKSWKCAKKDPAQNGDWAFELASPNGLMRLGWTRNSLKIGDTVTVEGTRARDGSQTGNARAAMTGDGKRLFAGSAEGAASR